MTHQTLVALVAKWRQAEQQAARWADEHDAQHDGANAHAFRKERRIWRTCADELEAILTGQEGAAPSPRAEEACKQGHVFTRPACQFSADGWWEWPCDCGEISRDWPSPEAEQSITGEPPEGTEPAAQREGAASKYLCVRCQAEYDTPQIACSNTRVVNGELDACEGEVREVAAQEPPPQAEERER